MTTQHLDLQVKIGQYQSKLLNYFFFDYGCEDDDRQMAELYEQELYERTQGGN